MQDRSVIDILYRHSHDDQQDGWRVVATAEGEREAEDELASWQGPRLYHGDLVRVGTEKLYVFNGASSALMAAPEVRVHGLKMFWLRLWEQGSNPDSMMLVCTRVDRRKIVSAAVAVVTSSIKISRSNARLKRTLLSALDAATGWSVGLRTVDDAVEQAAVVMRIVDRDGDQFAHATVDALQAVYSEDPAESARQALNYAANCSEASLGSRYVAMVGHARLVAKAIPLSVAVCARLGLADPIPWRNAPSDTATTSVEPTRTRGRRGGRG